MYGHYMYGCSRCSPFYIPQKRRKNRTTKKYLNQKEHQVLNWYLGPVIYVWEKSWKFLASHSPPSTTMQIWTDHLSPLCSVVYVSNLPLKHSLWRFVQNFPKRFNSEINLCSMITLQYTIVFVCLKVTSNTNQFFCSKIALDV